MVINNTLFTLQITSLLRPPSASVSYKAIEASVLEELPATSSSATATSTAATLVPVATLRATGAAATCVEVEFIPTLNFIFEKPTLSSEQQSPENSEHVAPGASDKEPADDCDSDNDSTHTYIISRSSWTEVTSSSTPYAVTSTDTAELLRRQNNLSLTEEDQSVSSFSIEQPTSSMTIDMAEQQTTRTTTTGTTTTSSADVMATTATTTTTTSSSIEEEIEEAIEISEVEEQLNSPLESLSEAAAFARPKDKQSSAKSLSSNPDGEEDEDADEFRIDDSIIFEIKEKRIYEDYNLTDIT